MKRLRVRISTLMLLVVIAALVVSRAVERQRAAERVLAEQALTALRVAGPFAIGVIPGEQLGPPRVTFTSDGKKLIVVGSGDDRRVLAWDVARREVCTPTLPSRPEDFWSIGDLSPNGRLLAYRDSTPDHRSHPQLRIVNLAAGIVQASYDLPDNIPRWGLTFSRDGTKFAVGGPRRSVDLFDSKTGKLLAELKPNEPFSGANRLAFSPDGKVIAIGRQDPTVVLLDVATGKERDRFERLPGVNEHDPPQLNSLVFSPDGRLLVEVRDNEVLLRDIATGNELFRDKDGIGSGFGQRSCIIGFTPYGRRLVSVSMEGHTRLMEIPSGRLVRTLDLFATAGPKESINELRLSPDRRNLAGSLDGGSVIVWDLSSLIDP
jgi:WD40 repeat protein